MSNFQEFNKQRWDKLPFKDKQILISVALNTTASVWQGSKKSAEDILSYADEILEHYWEFDQMKKPAKGAQSGKAYDAQGDGKSPF